MVNLTAGDDHFGPFAAIGCDAALDHVSMEAVTRTAQTGHSSPLATLRCRFTEPAIRLTCEIDELSDVCLAGKVSSEVTHMIRKGQLSARICPFRQFAELAA